jgi:uncharacterized protein (DUF2147 family)
MAEAKAADAVGLEGNWSTPAGSVVQVYRCGPELCLKVAQVEKDATVSTDVNNPDAGLRARPLCGLEIGHGFRSGGEGKADGGKLYDPKSGKTYSGSMVAHGDELKLRGYVGVAMFGRTETWHRVGEVGACR